MNYDAKSLLIGRLSSFNSNLLMLKCFRELTCKYPFLLTLKILFLLQKAARIMEEEAVSK
jgi:hypothetical protein